MDLNQTISDSLKSTPVESANRGIVSELGQQFDLITKPILNLSPHQQVAMRQVNSQIPSPIQGRCNDGERKGRKAVPNDIHTKS